MTRRAYALQQLLSEVNARFPLRDTSTDGWVGDSAHQARPSDHNPNGAGVVCAQDFDEDAKDGPELVGRALWTFLLDRRDRRVGYAIYEGQMVRDYDKPGIPAWTVAPYTGSNGHFGHLHLSVDQDPALYDDPSPWGFDSWMEDPMNVIRIVDGQFSDRFGTAWAIARTRFPRPDGGKTVAIARDGSPDAQLGVSLGYPLLLVTKDSVPGGTAAALKFYNVETILVLGGEQSVPKSVVDRAAEIAAG
jgi:hypothetical protein